MANDPTLPAITAHQWEEYRRSLPRSRKIFESVDEKTSFGATPAAFQSAQAGPSRFRPSAYEIYNKWAEGVLADLLAQKSSIGTRVASRAEFNVWHEELIASLNAAWVKSAHKDFPISSKQKRKLVNLFVKWLAPKATAPGLRDAIFANGHVVLNTPTIAKMEALFGTEMPACPAQPTEAEFAAWYADCQELVRTYTSAAQFGGSPVLFDVWCRADYLSDPD
jgi:hypothetical protein